MKKKISNLNFLCCFSVARVVSSSYLIYIFFNATENKLAYSIDACHDTNLHRGGVSILRTFTVASEAKSKFLSHSQSRFSQFVCSGQRRELRPIQ